MPSPARFPVTLSKNAARLIWLRAQRLDELEPFGGGPDATRAAIEHLGYLQIDTIHVIERCHHHILWNRIPGYRREHLHQAQTVDKSVFEYWTHALSYVPTRDLRFFLPEMKRQRQSPKKLVCFCFEGGSAQGPHARPPRRSALDPRYRRRRLGGEGPPVGQSKAFKARAPARVLYRRADDQRTFRHDQKLRADGSSFWLEYETQACDRTASSGLPDPSVPCDPRGWSASTRSVISTPSGRRRSERQSKCGYAEANWFRSGSRKPKNWSTGQNRKRSNPFRPSDGGRVHILSPFDPLIIQRKRLGLIFEYDHRFEAYVPKEKRVMGYFALPVLVDDQIVAAIDLKADRENKVLRIQQWTWVGKGAKRHKRRIEEELHRFEHFQVRA